MSMTMLRPKQRAFLGVYRQCANVRLAARLARCARSQHYWWLKQPAYAEAFAEARAEACDALEAEARRRAVKGVRKPVYYKGKVVGFNRKYSDTLLMFLMKGAMPEKYRDNVKMKKTGGAELLKRLEAGRVRARLGEGRHSEAAVATLSRSVGVCILPGEPHLKSLWRRPVCA